MPGWKQSFKHSKNSLFLLTFCSYTVKQTIYRGTYLRCVWEADSCGESEYTNLTYNNQRISFTHFWSSTIWEMVRREHELVEQADSVQPHPAGDSSGTPKYALWDQPSEPLIHCDSLPFFSVFSPAAQLHILPASRTFCLPLRSSTMQCCFPHCTCDKGWKSTDTRTEQDLFLKHLSADVTRLCMLCCREAARRRKGTLEVNCMGQVGTWDIPRTS